MNEIAIYSGSTIIYWSAVIITLGIVAGFCLSYALYTANGGRKAAMWVMLPIALFLSVLFCRFIHWYCHAEQYPGMIKAITDYSNGGYCLPGMFIGIFLAGLIVKALHLTDSASEIYDAMAPGTALTIALIRLSSLFNSSCRSTIIIKNPIFRHLPVGIAVPTSTGLIEYRFATFFIQFILMMLMTGFITVLYCRRHKIPMRWGIQRGNIAIIFLALYGAVEVVLDSTRYDSSFFRLNGFISLVQIVSAVCLLAALVYYSVASIKARGFKFYHVLIWLVFAGGLALVGYFEYLVQRHGDWYIKCYTVMSIGAVLMFISGYITYLTVCDKDAMDED